MYRRLFIIFSFILLSISIQAQKWQPGRFTDIKGNIQTGLIRVDPSGKAPIKGEGFIEFKEDNKAEPFKLSASDLRSFVVGKDSFVVAHAPQNENWSRNELDFVKVVLDEPVKLYVAKASSGGGHGFGFSPGISTGIGTGGYGGAFGGGISIPIGSGGREKTTWYFGENTAEMKRLTSENFEDIMTDIMGDEPDVVDKIHSKVYVLANIDKLLAYFKQVAASH
ncbi:MAG: hypothetical protein JWR02_2888 [Mucilaginibacter sp.]|nr:hypothetical protein [Mucilaginibacter sp.]